MAKNTEKVKKEKLRALKGSCLWGLLVFGLLLLIDLVTKIAAEEYFTRADAPHKIDIIPGWLSLRLTYNRGIAYGVGATSPTWIKVAVIVATGVLMLAFAILYFKLDKAHGWARVALVFVVAGGVGNLIDRIYFQVWDTASLGGVRDMVDLSRFGFAVCNFADFFITGGAVALVLSLLFFDRDALFPVGKYRAQAKAHAEEIEAKEQEEKATVEKGQTQENSSQEGRNG